MITKICTACVMEKPLADFVQGRTTCKRCRSIAVWNYEQDMHDRRRHQRQVELNRLINSIPRVMI